MAELRDLARGLHPSALDRDGLAGCADRCGRAAVGAGGAAGRGRPAGDRGRGERLLRDLRGLGQRQQALHADRAWVRVAATDGGVEIDVRDDGVGGAASRVTACGGSPTAWWPSVVGSASEQRRDGDLGEGVGAMRVILADDSMLFRTGLSRLLEATGVEVLAEIADAAEPGCGAGHPTRRGHRRHPYAARVPRRGARRGERLRRTHPGLAVPCSPPMSRSRWPCACSPRLPAVGLPAQGPGRGCGRFHDALARLVDGQAVMTPRSSTASWNCGGAATPRRRLPARATSCAPWPGSVERRCRGDVAPQRAHRRELRGPYLHQARSRPGARGTAGCRRSCCGSRSRVTAGVGH